MSDDLRQALLKTTDIILVDAAGVSNAPQLVDEIIAVFRRHYKGLAREMRAAFDGDSIPRKNIALRKAHDALNGAVGGSGK